MSSGSKLALLCLEAAFSSSDCRTQKLSENAVLSRVWCGSKACDSSSSLGTFLKLCLNSLGYSVMFCMSILESKFKA